MAGQISKEANTVDKDGKAWETVGENIRNSSGSGGGTIDLKSTLDLLFPVGSYYVGAIPEIWKTVSTWNPLVTSGQYVVSNSSNEPFYEDIASGNIGENIDTINIVIYTRTK